MAVTTTHLTVDQFRQLHEGSGGVYYELRHGEVIPLTRPKLKHSLIQRTLRQLLEQFAEPGSLVDVEVAFRPLPEYELWVADVAYLSAARFQQANVDDNIQGAPDIVIEVLSPSNTAAEIYDKEKICLENGAQQFWVVDPDRRQVKVSLPDGHTITYHAGQQIPIDLFAASLPVNAIFVLK